MIAFAFVSRDPRFDGYKIYKAEIFILAPNPTLPRVVTFRAKNYP